MRFDTLTTPGMVLVSLACVTCVALCGCPQKAEVPTPVQAAGPTEYVFSTDWFSGNIPVWEEAFARYKGKPDLAYLEIGTFEGRSFFWMLDNIVTHPTSHATGIDLFPLDLRRRFDANLAASGQANRVSTIAGSSQAALRTLPLASYDIIYVDGSHAAKNVLEDAVLCWGLLKNDGMLILDDYEWRLDWPLEFRPQVAVDAFLTVYRNDLEVVHRGEQVIIRKVEMPTPYILRLGDYAYFWRQQQLCRIGEQTQTTPGSGEQAAIARLAMSRGFAETSYGAKPELVSDPEVQAVLERLDLELDQVPPPSPGSRTGAGDGEGK